MEKGPRGQGEQGFHHSPNRRANASTACCKDSILSMSLKSTKSAAAMRCSRGLWLRITASMVAENNASFYRTPEEAMVAWMATVPLVSRASPTTSHSAGAMIESAIEPEM